MVEVGCLHKAIWHVQSQRHGVKSSSRPYDNDGPDERHYSERTSLPEWLERNREETNSNPVAIGYARPRLHVAYVHCLLIADLIFVRCVLIPLNSKTKRLGQDATADNNIHLVKYYYYYYYYYLVLLSWTLVQYRVVLFYYFIIILQSSLMQLTIYRSLSGLLAPSSECKWNIALSDNASQSTDCSRPLANANELFDQLSFKY